MADSSWLMGKGCSCQGAEDRSQRTEDGGRRTEVGCRRTGVEGRYG